MNKKFHLALYAQFYRLCCPDKTLKSVETYRKKNIVKTKEAKQKYYKLHKKFLNQQTVKRAYAKYNGDLAFKIKQLIRSRIQKTVKRNSKKSASLQLLGCSIPEYRHYLQNGFLPGMCWENKGEWHIDHVKSISSFDLSTLEGQKAAFHYPNTQPLWAVDNRQKHCKLQ